jgi:hypothetical protein
MYQALFTPYNVNVEPVAKVFALLLAISKEVIAEVERQSPTAADVLSLAEFDLIKAVL